MVRESQSTDERLLLIAIQEFGRYGRDGVSTRKIARLADTPMSSITYHFGGKDGLYLAAAQHIAKIAGEQLIPLLDAAGIDTAKLIDPPLARATLHDLLRGFFDFLVMSEPADFARFVMREQAEPSEAFEILFEPNMRRMLECMAHLINCVAGGELMTQEARVRAVALLGSVLIFRVGRETALRAAGLAQIDESNSRMLRHVIHTHLDAVLHQLESTGSLHPRRFGARDGSESAGERSTGGAENAAGDHIQS